MPPSSKSFSGVFKPTPTTESILKQTFEELPDGQVEFGWSEDQIKTFMQKYLMMDCKKELPVQNKKSWGYELWLFCIEKYAEGVSFAKIAGLAEPYFPSVQTSGNPTKLVASIVNHKGWKLGAQMRILIRERQMNELQEGKASSALRAQKAELEHLGTLEKQLADNVALMEAHSATSLEYAAAMRNVKDLEKLISKFSGADLMKKMQEFKAKEQIKSDGQQNHLPADPKTITPKLIG